MRNRLAAGAAAGAWGRMQLRLLAGIANHAVTGVVTCNTLKGDKEPEFACQSVGAMLAVDCAIDEKVSTMTSYCLLVTLKAIRLSCSSETDRIGLHQ